MAAGRANTGRTFRENVIKRRRPGHKNLSWISESAFSEYHGNLV
jgi:hypothetical protein